MAPIVSGTQRSLGLIASCLLLGTLIISPVGSHNAQAARTAAQKMAAGYVIPTNIKTRGYLAIGTNPPYYPMEDVIPDTSNCCIGADIDLGNAIAKLMGLKVKWIGIQDFGALMIGNNGSTYDMVMSSVNVTPDRAKRMHLVGYMNVGQAIAVQKGNPQKITDVLSLSGHSVAVQSGTVEVDAVKAANMKLAAAGKSKIDVHSFTDDGVAAAAVATGQVDALFDDYPIVAWRVKQSQGRARPLVMAGPQFSITPYAIAIPLKSNDLYHDVQMALSKIMANGSYAKILAKYGLSSAALKK